MFTHLKMLYGLNLVRIFGRSREIDFGCPTKLFADAISQKPREVLAPLDFLCRTKRPEIVFTVLKSQREESK